MKQLTWIGFGFFPSVIFSNLHFVSASEFIFCQTITTSDILNNKFITFDINIALTDMSSKDDNPTLYQYYTTRKNVGG